MKAINAAVDLLLVRAFADVWFTSDQARWDSVPGWASRHARAAGSVGGRSLARAPISSEPATDEEQLSGGSRQAVTLAEATPVPDDQPSWDAATAGSSDRISAACRLLGIYAIVRVALLTADVFAAHVSYGSNLDGPLHSWDSNWYLIVASHGYPPVAPTAGGRLTYSAAGFLPVFPGLIRIFTVFDLSSLKAALIVSLIGGAVTTLLVWRLATVVLDEAAGWNAAVLFVLFPGMGICGACSTASASGWPLSPAACC